MSGNQEQFYLAEEGRILGTGEFIDATIHRIGESVRSDPHKSRRRNKELNLSALIESVEVVCDVPRELFCGSGKRACAVRAKELFLVTGTEMGVSLKTLAGIIGLNSSTTSRRHDSARLKMIDDEDMSKLAAEIMRRFSGGR